MPTSRVIFKGNAFYRKFPTSKTSRWHLDRLSDVSQVEAWINEGPESYRQPRLFLAANMARYTRGFSRGDTVRFRNRGRALVAAAVV